MYYFQVQQQLFTLTERKFDDFVVCGIDCNKKAHIVKELIYPDVTLWQTVLAKLEAFREFVSSPRFWADGIQESVCYLQVYLMSMPPASAKPDEMKT